MATLYAVSPWIDAVNSVSLANAPVVGTRPTRIIKTHLPASLCPYSADAKYIYVARHPVSCFASIIDFNRSMVRSAASADWTRWPTGYCSDKMYWSPWPSHVEGWWRWSQERGNVLFVHFETMKRDPGGVIDQVAAFLGVALTADGKVASRCAQPVLVHEGPRGVLRDGAADDVLAAGGEFMASGKEKRHEDVTPAVRNRILGYCARRAEGASYPVSRWYPDVAAFTPDAGASR
jgi:hypothetical protein